MEKKILEWMSTDETGISSKAMAFASVGIKSSGSFSNYTPSDPSDFNRCLKLVAHVPEVKEMFPVIAKLSKQWEVVINNWDVIEASFLNEVGFDWCNGKSAPETYKLMKSLGL